MRTIGEDGLLPDDLARELLSAYHSIGAGSVAVRSSAVEEDSADHSFSGVYETRLNVDGDEHVLEAVRQCWQAYWHQSAVVYRRDAGVPESPGLALLVQPMLPALSAGVVFTANPANGHLGEVVVNATLGLAEPLVAGQVDADQFVVRRADGGVLSRHIGKKEITLNALGTSDSSPRAVQQSSLSDGNCANSGAGAAR